MWLAGVLLLLVFALFLCPAPAGRKHKAKNNTLTGGEVQV